MKVFYVVHGAVQGVGYRSHVAAVARKYKVRGMVRNMRDGSVQIFAEGDEKQLQSFEKEINVSVRSGPQVFNVERYDENAKGFKHFGPYNEFVREETV